MKPESNQLLMDARRRAIILARMPWPRFLQPDELAAAVVFR